MTTIQEMIDSPKFDVIHLVGGMKGAYRKVTGINVIESIDLAMFCRPNELMITTGIQLVNDEEALLNLISTAHSKRTAGFIINTGPYIPEIPQSVIHFANEHNYPIFQMDWEERIADLLKVTFEFITIYQQQHSSVETLLTNLLFHYDRFAETLQKQMEQHHYPNGAEIGVITCTTTSFQHKIDRYEGIIKAAFQKRYRHFLSAKIKNHLVFIINRGEVKTPNIPFSRTIEELYEEVIEKNDSLDLVVGMGNFYTNLRDISKSYDESQTVIHLAQLHNNRFILKYKEIGAYKILMGLPNRSIIETFRQDMLGRLYRYDELHNTDLTRFLRIFLEEDGSTSKIGEREFIHRNTVLYKIRKIETILDANLSNTFTKTNLYIAFMIEDILTKTSTNN